MTAEKFSMVERVDDLVQHAVALEWAINGSQMDVESYFPIKILAAAHTDRIRALRDEIEEKSEQTVDPIFPALAEWERLDALHLEAIKRTDAAQVSGDKDAYAAANQAQGVACNAAFDQELKILATRPTTIAGALRLLRFIADIGRDTAGRGHEKADAIIACADIIEGARP